MATRKEWAWRALSFALGFAAGRLAVPRDEVIGQQFAEEETPNDEELFAAIVSLISGVYQIIRYLVEHPEIFHNATQRLGPRALHRWQSAIEHWPDIFNVYCLTVDRIDALFGKAVSRVLARIEEASPMGAIGKPLQPHYLVTTLPPKDFTIAIDIAREVGRNYRQFVSELSSKVADTDSLEEIGLSKIDAALCLNEVLIAIRPIMRIACDFAIAQWSQDDPTKEGWFFVSSLFMSGESTSHWLKCEKCGWEVREETNRTTFVWGQDVCPNCGNSSNVVAIARSEDV